MNKNYFVLIGLLFLIPLVSNIEAYSVSPLSKSIGVDISKQCSIMIRNNFTTSCPSIKDLYDLGLDTSDRKKSGDFSFYDGMFQREEPALENHYRYYDFQGFNIFINPPSDMQDRTKMIFIESNFDVYLLSADMVKENNTRTIHKDLFVDAKCREVTINANNWKRILPDAIAFLRHDCDPKFTTLETMDTITDKQTYQDIATSQKYKHEQWEKEIKQTHIENKIGKDNSTNRSVTEDKDPKYVPPKTPPFDYSKYR